jgi:hypothetical protein
LKNPKHPVFMIACALETGQKRRALRQKQSRRQASEAQGGAPKKYFRFNSGGRDLQSVKKTAIAEYATTSPCRIRKGGNGFSGFC